MSVPRLIEFAKLGSPALGYITVSQNGNLPFTIQRVYWTYFTPDAIIRGHHAHHELEQLIFATSGHIEFVLEGMDGKKEKFILDAPNKGLYIPKQYWRTIKFSHNAVLLCLCSQEYQEEDYIRDYAEFAKLQLGSGESLSNE
jgi:dTDP-4-dehydrorhamnose 3,5-epimerase-like enzyme